MKNLSKQGLFRYQSTIFKREAVRVICFGWQQVKLCSFFGPTQVPSRNKNLKNWFKTCRTLAEVIDQRSFGGKIVFF